MIKGAKCALDWGEEGWLLRLSVWEAGSLGNAVEKQRAEIPLVVPGHMPLWIKVTKHIRM